MASDPSRSRGRHGPLLVGAGVLVGIGAGVFLWNASIETGTVDGAMVGAAGLASGETFAAASPDVTGNGDRAEYDWLSDALEYLDEVGFSVASIEQLAATLPVARAQALRVIASEGLAATDLRAAIAYALGFELHTEQTAVLHRVARIAAAANPRFALVSAELIPNGTLRAAFVEAVLGTWAVLDPSAALAYLERDGLSASPVTVETLDFLASTEPERLLALFDQLPFDASTSAVRATLIDALLASNPGALYAYVDAERFGISVASRLEYEVLVAEIARRHIRIDPTEALQHLLSVRTPMVIAVHEALLAVPDETFEADFRTALDRSIDMLASGEEHQGSGGRLGWLFRSAFERGMSDVGALLDAVANHPSSRVRNQIGIGFEGDSGIVAIWAESDPESAIAWTMRNTSRVSPNAIEHLGRLFAGELADPAAAQRTLYELPEEIRGYWMAGIAEGFASSNLDLALAWLEPARGTAVYTTAMDNVLRSAVATDPVALASIIDNRAEPPGTALIVNLAHEWGAREPSSAGDWLVSSRNIDDDLRSVAVRQLVLDWSERDPDRALTWAQRLGRNELHDAALGAVIETAAAAGTLEPRLLAGFSSDDSRAEAIIGTMWALRGIDPELGQSLIDQYLSDADQRAAAEDILDGRERYRIPDFVDGVEIR